MNGSRVLAERLRMTFEENYGRLHNLRQITAHSAGYTSEQKANYVR
jgi:hypothetical protein